MDKQFCLWSSNALWVTGLMINWKCSFFCGEKTHFMNWACLEAAQLKVNIISFCPNVLLDSGESRVIGVLQDAAAYEKTLKFGIIIISVTLSWCCKKWLSIIQQFFSFFQERWGEILWITLIEVTTKNCLMMTPESLKK